MSSKESSRPGRKRQRTARPTGDSSQTHRDADRRTKRESNKSAGSKSADKRTKAQTIKTSRAAPAHRNRQRHRDGRAAQRGRALQLLGVCGGGQFSLWAGAPSSYRRVGSHA